MDDPASWLSNMAAIAPPYHAEVKEMPYTEEAGWFFVNLVKGIFAINEKVKPFVEPEQLQKLINSGQKLIGG